MRELTLQATVDNMPRLMLWLDSQLEELDCPMKAQMREREEAILGALGITRD